MTIRGADGKELNKRSLLSNAEKDKETGDYVFTEDVVETREIRGAAEPGTFLLFGKGQRVSEEAVDALFEQREAEQKQREASEDSARELRQENYGSGADRDQQQEKRPGTSDDKK